MGNKSWRQGLAGAQDTTEEPMVLPDNLPIGVIAERRALDNPWIDHKWMPVAVFTGAAPIEDWTKTAEGDGWQQFHIGTLPVELFRKETEAYKVNLSNKRPAVYVVLREAEEPEDPDIRAVHVTVSPYEAQDYLDTGEDIVEAVPMPEDILAWVQGFINQHHVDEPFKKRKRKDYRNEPDQFGKVLDPIEARFFDRLKKDRETMN